MRDVQGLLTTIARPDPWRPRDPFVTAWIDVEDDLRSDPRNDEGRRLGRRPRHPSSADVQSCASSMTMRRAGSRPWLVDVTPGVPATR